jgi:uncharacterized protein YutE (UPF0331/DUF86 family)
MMIDDIIVDKSNIIKRCINRINEEYNDNPDNLFNFTKQDSIVLNIQRACEAVIDIAMHIISEKNLSIPNSSREAFDILEKNKIIENDVSGNMKKMVGFRNIAVHQYQNLEIKIIRYIIEKDLLYIKTFVNQILDFN